MFHLLLNSFISDDNDTPVGLCPQNYRFTNQLNRPLCQRIYTDAKTWWEADRICRQDRANLGTVPYYATPSNIPHWWINWKQLNFSSSLSTGNTEKSPFGSLNIPPGVGDWYQETIYGQNRFAAVRRVPDLTTIRKVEFGDNYNQQL